MPSTRKLRVLVLATDIFRTVGGGETVYKHLFWANPLVEFTYFRLRESAQAERPANAKTVPLRDARRLGVADPLTPGYRVSALAEADRYARAVAGMDFDIVEIPDYRHIGALVPSALQMHSVSYRALVLAMHGNISKSLALGWQSSGDNTFDIEQLELEQFVLVDAVYAISRRYILEWTRHVRRPVHYIEPLSVIEPPKLLPFRPTHARPALYCIGRMEGRKGADLFIELVRWLDSWTYSEAISVGEVTYTSDGLSSDEILNQFAARREMSIKIERSLDRAGLQAIFADRSFVVLPVRYDTLNLVAIEALLSGCPVAVSSAAGVCDWLDAEFPGIPYTRIDMTNFYAAATKIEEVLRNYDAHRTRLRSYLERHPLRAYGADLQTVYADALHGARVADRATVPMIEYTAELSVSGAMKRAARHTLPTQYVQAMKQLTRNPRAVLVHLARKSGLFNDAKFMRNAAEAGLVGRRLRQLGRLPEHNLDALRRKLENAYLLCKVPLYRGTFWREIARIERLRGNDLVAATYEIRLLRLLDKDPFGLLPGVTDTLIAHGFEREAIACEALYGDPGAAPERVFAYLQDQRQRHLTKSFSPLERVLDQRRGTARVSIIVSLYKASQKLRVFLTALSQQSLIRVSPEAVEVILVDSGSPFDELGALNEHLREHPLNVLYVRSTERETIQAAWNRGIGLARGEYLVFLGVDETLYPEALEVLTTELDRHPRVDWAMGNSLVTSVDQNGMHTADIFTYDRTGGTKDHTYLETCYVSWVGGMYRRSIHERFGWYDDSFGAAGDTEFKNRVFPFIEVRFIPRLLGLFLNYPDERTTESPRAEIEDTRAWYIHRTPGGVRYAFADRDPAHAMRLLCAALGYRKSYCKHVSTDIEYALQLAKFLAPDPAHGSLARSLEPGLIELLSDLQRMECVGRHVGMVSSLRVVLQSKARASRIRAAHRALVGTAAAPQYMIYNDNRFEQHSWLWKTK